MQGRIGLVRRIARKEIFTWSLLFIYLMCLMPAYSADAECEVASKAAILMDVNTGRVLWEQNADLQRAPASTTKMLTAIVAIEEGNVNDKVRVSKRASEEAGSSLWLQEGEVLKLQELLYGMMLKSGNDAAMAIAEHIGGSVEQFAEMMNNKAAEIGTKNSHFANPNGLPNDNHYSSAYDLAAIARYGLRNSLFSEIVKTRTKVIPDPFHEWDRKVYNTNRLLGKVEGIDGVKTGYTDAAGHCLVASATRNNHQLVAVVLGSANMWEDSQRLLNYGFDRFEFLPLGEKEAFKESLPVKGGVDARVRLSLTDDLILPVKIEEKDKVAYELELPAILNAPVLKGTKVGEAKVYLDGELILQKDIIADHDVEKKSFFKSIFGAFRSFLAMALEKII